MADNVTNTNTTTNDREKLSVAEKIFVPKDLDKDGNISDYTEYKIKFFNWRMVPENHVLVTKNRFTGEIKVKSGIGMKFMLPFVTKSILVSTVDRTIDYEKIDYLTKDGIMANMDIAIVIHISDPKKYMNGGKEQIEQLNILVKQLLRLYVANRNYDSLSQGECRLTDFDAERKFQAFSNLYGISVSKVIFKEVRLPERMQKLYNDKVEEEQKKQAQEIRLKAEKEKAHAEAEILGIQSDAEAKKMAKLFKALADEGVPMEDVMKYLNIKTASANGNTIFMSGNGMNNDVAMGVTAGNIASQRTNRNNQTPNNIQNPNSTQQSNDLKNSTKVIQQLKIYKMRGIELTDDQKEIYDALMQNEEVRVTIDNFNEQEYNNFLSNLFPDKDFTNTNNSTVKRPRR